MIFDRLSRDMSLFRQKIVLGIFIFLIVLPTFFAGEWSKWLQAVIFIIVPLLLVYTYLLFKGQPRNSWNREAILKQPLFYFCLFVAVVFFTSFFSTNAYLSFSQFFWLISYGIILFAAYYFFRSWRWLRFIVHLIFWAGAAVALITLAMYISQSGSRAEGFLFNANALGSYLLFSLPLGIFLAVNCQKKVWRTFYFFGWVIILIAFIASFSYTGWASFLVPLMIMAGYFRKTIFSRRSLMAMLIVVIAALAAVVLFRYSLSGSFNDALKIYDTITPGHFIFSFSQRLNFVSSSWDIFRDNAFIGNGYNTFQSVYGLYYHTIFEQPRYAHNYYLQTAAELGIFGITFLLAFLSRLFFGIKKMVTRETNPANKNIYLGLGLGLLGSAIHSLFDFGWQFPAVFILFCLITGILLAQGRWENKEQATDPGSQSVAPCRQLMAGILISVLALIIFFRGITLFIGVYQESQAEIYLGRGESQLAYSAFSASYRLDPDPAVLNKYLLEKMNKTPEIFKQDYLQHESQLKSVLKFIPDNSSTHWVLGRLYFTQNNYELAETEYNQAISLNPVFRPDYYYDLAFLYFQQKKFEQAKKVILGISEKYYEGISSSNPSLPTQMAFLNILLGDIYKETDNLEKAKASYLAAGRWNSKLRLVNDKLKEVQ